MPCMNGKHLLYISCLTSANNTVTGFSVLVYCVARVLPDLVQFEMVILNLVQSVLFQLIRTSFGLGVLQTGFIVYLLTR
jgi:hypothetical protein